MDNSIFSIGSPGVRQVGGSNPPPATKKKLVVELLQAFLFSI
jgi:hypothetical protein